MTSDPVSRRHFVGTKRDPMWTLWRWPRWPCGMAGNPSKWVRCRKVGYFTNYWRWRKVAVPGNIYIYINVILLYNIIYCVCIYIYMCIYILCNYNIYIYYVYLLYDLLKPVSSLCQACFKPDWIPWCLLFLNAMKTQKSCWRIDLK